MRSLYWKIFLSFWLTSVLIIIIIVWNTSQMAQKSVFPAQEKLFMDSHATAAVATFEAGRSEALKKWLAQTGQAKKMIFYLLSNSGEIIGNQDPPEEVKAFSATFRQTSDNNLVKFRHILISHEILSTSGHAYRLIAVSDTPIVPLATLPWTALIFRSLIAILVSGLICYLLSLYLTWPLRLLRLAAKSIARGKLSTRVGHLKGHNHDEIAELSDEFDRMAEKLEILVNTKERLLQDISHELRSPLARLQIAIELARQKTDPVAESEFRRMEDECNRLGSLIAEILEFARLRCPSILDKKKIDLKALLEEVIDDANFEWGKSKACVFLKESEKCFVEGDKRLLNRALENIIRNSMHYAKPNPIVEVSLITTPGRPEVVIDIKDNGPGVPEDQLSNIFSPFYRVDSSRQKITGGYGLGLSIVHRAIELHGGVVTAKNSPHNGFIVSIILPKVNPES